MNLLTTTPVDAANDLRETVSLMRLMCDDLNHEDADEMHLCESVYADTMKCMAAVSTYAVINQGVQAEYVLGFLLRVIVECNEAICDGKLGAHRGALIRNLNAAEHYLPVWAWRE